MPITIGTAANDSTPSEVSFELAVDHLVRVRRSGTVWTSTDETLPWTTDTVVARGAIQSSLYEAIDRAAATLPRQARAELAWTLADIYEYRVDMSRELQRGDSFRVLFVRAAGPGGTVRIGDVLAARFTLSGSSIEAIRFAGAGGRREYFDGTGRSMRAAFLRAPLQFRRISSRFGLRLHPILGIWRQHTGTDYAAAAGTPVRAIGDGIVLFAGRRGGYGNLLELRHRNGFVSRYGHLRAFASGIRPGRSVGIGQTIAFVGMTGLATAPHLHFEILVNGVQRDSRTALARVAGFPVAPADRAHFDQVRSTLVGMMDARELAKK
jgi:murein DD-endopeptidase MepM/ murein hydrolase activator NlpD